MSPARRVTVPISPDAQALIELAIREARAQAEAGLAACRAVEGVRADQLGSQSYLTGQRLATLEKLVDLFERDDFELHASFSAQVTITDDTSVRVLDVDSPKPKYVCHCRLIDFEETNEMSAEDRAGLRGALNALGAFIIGGGAAPAYMVEVVEGEES